MTMSPQNFLRKKVDNIKGDESFDDNENREHDLSAINPNLDNSRTSPFFDTEGSYIN